MRSLTLAKQNLLYFSTAAIAAHAFRQEPGFRQRDVRFYIELFSNWVMSGSSSFSLEVQNTQVQRFLDDLVTDGYAKRTIRAKRPYYNLTRIGLVDILTQVIDTNYLSEKEQFYFLFYFIKNYKPKLEELIRAEGKRFPSALRIELESLLDEHDLLETELKAARKELDKLEQRIRDCQSIHSLAEKNARSGEGIDEVVQQIEEQYPYELNSQKPMSELMKSLPMDARKWEVSVGFKARANDIWKPAREMLKSYIRSLEQLR